MKSVENIWIRFGHRIISRFDIIIAIAFFFAAVVVVTLYISTFLSSGVNSYIMAGNTPLHISGNRFSGGGDLPMLRIIARLCSMFIAVFPHVSPLGILYGVVIVLVYGIFRLGMGRIAAVLCTLSLMISSTQLNHLVPFWDKYYCRPPFIFSLVLIMGILVVKPFKPFRTIGLATVAGIVMGVGLRFRPDLWVFIPNFVLTLFCFMPGPMFVNLKVKLAPLKVKLAPLMVKLAALICFVLASYFSFSIAAPCILTRGANSHAVLGGSTPINHIRLGLTDPGYDWDYLLLDEFTSSMSFAQTRVFEVFADGFNFNEYVPAFDKFLKRIVKNFPADTLVRFYAAALKVMEIPFTYALPPAGITSPFITAIYGGRAVLLNLFAGLGPWLCGAALLMISTKSLRKSIFCFLLLPSMVTIVFVHLAGYYFFYLEFIAYWALGFILHHGVIFIARLVKQESRNKIKQWIVQPRLWWNPAAKRVVVFASATALLLWTPLFVIRQYQSSNVSHILRQYDTAELEPLPLEAISLENNGVLLTNPQQFKPLTEKSFKFTELMAEFSDQTCGYSTVWVTLRYRGTSGMRMDFSRSMSVDLAPTNKTRLFFPAMAQKDVYIPGYSNYFAGIEISADQKDCLRGLYNVKDLKRLPIMLTLKRPLPDNYLYRRLAEWEDSHRLHTVPDKLPATRVKELFAKPLLPITDAEIDYRDPIFHLQGGQGGKPSTSWIVNGYAKDNSAINPLFPIQGPRWQFGRSSLVDAQAILVDTDLLITKATWHKKGSAFVARGKLYCGGVVFGLMKDNRPSGSVIIATPGAFDVIIEAPQDGLYAVALANYVTYYNTMENRLVAQAGWVEQ